MNKSYDSIDLESFFGKNLSLMATSVEATLFRFWNLSLEKHCGEVSVPDSNQGPRVSNYPRDLVSLETILGLR